MDAASSCARLHGSSCRRVDRTKRRVDSGLDDRIYSRHSVPWAVRIAALSSLAPGLRYRDAVHGTQNRERWRVGHAADNRCRECDQTALVPATASTHLCGGTCCSGGETRALAHVASVPGGNWHSLPVALQSLIARYYGVGRDRSGRSARRAAHREQTPLRRHEAAETLAALPRSMKSGSLASVGPDARDGTGHTASQLQAESLDRDDRAVSLAACRWSRGTASRPPGRRCRFAVALCGRRNRSALCSTPRMRLCGEDRMDSRCMGKSKATRCQSRRRVAACWASAESRSM